MGRSCASWRQGGQLALNRLDPLSLGRIPYLPGLSPLILCLLLLTCLPARAAVPGLVGPLQTLLAMIPQLFGLLVGLLGGIWSLSYWRIRLRYYARGCAIAVLGAGAAAALVLWRARTPETLLATASPSATAAAFTRDWPSFRGDLGGGGTGTVDAAALRDHPLAEWSYSDNDGSEYMSSPVVQGERLYVGTARFKTVEGDGSIECLDARDGHLIWRSVTTFAVFASPIVVDGRIYCGEGLHENRNSRLYCLEAATGKTLYTVPIKSHAEAAPTMCGDRLVFSAGDDGFICIDPKDGHKLWTNDCGHCDCSAASDGTRIYVGTAYKSDSAVCIDLQAGKTIWKVHQDLPLWGHPAVKGNRVLFGLGNGTFSSSDAKNPRGAVVSIDSLTGAKIWRTEVGDSVNTALCLIGDNVIFGSRDGYVYCIAEADGKLRWKSLCGKPLLSSLVVQGDIVLAAGGDGTISALDLANGKRRWSSTLAPVPFESSPILAGGRLYIGAGPLLLCLGK